MTHKEISAENELLLKEGTFGLAKTREKETPHRVEEYAGPAPNHFFEGKK